MNLSPSQTSVVFPKSIIVPNQELENIPIPPDPSLVNFIDISGNPIKTLQSLPQLKNLEKIIGDNTLIESFEGVIEQPNLTIISLVNTPISKSKYFILMTLIAFGHSLNIVNDYAITTRDLDNQLKYNSIIHDYIFKGYIIEQLKPMITLIKPSDGSKLTLPYSPSKSYFDQVENEKSIFSSPMSTTSLTRKDFDDLVQSHHHKKVKPDPIDILNYHKAALERFHGSLQKKKFHSHQSTFDDNVSIDISKFSVSEELREPNLSDGNE